MINPSEWRNAIKSTMTKVRARESYTTLTRTSTLMATLWALEAMVDEVDALQQENRNLRQRIAWMEELHDCDAVSAVHDNCHTD
jgi:regulator of replication initiation timing